jgi:hypothetical protein
MRAKQSVREIGGSPTESRFDFVENRPNRNAISKVYVSRSIERGLHPGDVIVFYRTKSPTGPAYYTSVATTLGVVQDVVTDIPSKGAFIEACRKRSVFTDQVLGQHWDYNLRNRPFIVNFLYVCSFQRRPNLKQLMDGHVLLSAPRGFEQLSDTSFETLLELANADKRLIIN